jgi:acetyltransferase-like isoleucine patch superfamily enzyme
MRLKIIKFLYRSPYFRWLLPVFHFLIGRSNISNVKGNSINTTTANLYYSRINFHSHKNNFLFIGEQTNLHHSKLEIKGSNNTIHIGSDCFINGLRLIIEGDNNDVYIGDHGFILDDTRIYVVDGSAFRMGSGCMFSDRIEIRTTDNHSIYDLNTGNRINYEEDVVLQDRVWIGTGVTILKGTVIANGCIVGAGSVLTRKYTTPNSIIVGTPGKYVKHNITWTMARWDHI